MKKFILFALFFAIQQISGQILFSPYLNHNLQPYNLSLEGSGTIYYTIDGTVPDLNSASGVNIVSVPITQNVVIKAILKDVNNQISPVISKPYYVGVIPVHKVFFKPPANWANSCSIRNYIQPITAVDFFPPGNPMTVACDGWYKASYDFYEASIGFNDCNAIGTPFDQIVYAMAEGTIYYDFSVGLITNPPACLLAVNDAISKVTLVKIYPNPVEDILQIETDLVFSNYELVDAVGRSLGNREFKSKNIVSLGV